MENRTVTTLPDILVHELSRAMTIEAAYFIQNKDIGKRMVAVKELHNKFYNMLKEAPIYLKWCEEEIEYAKQN